MPGAAIVTVVAFLSSDEAGYITRVVLPVDGGLNR
jgi:NAD(P)-dependent dehydrogenase (short-subunit alcohol dehydrogenase family)